jgi:hypothetical protein
VTRCGSRTTRFSSRSRLRSGRRTRAGDVGEAFATAGRIIEGDADSWLREWTATSEAVRAVAVEAQRAGARQRVVPLPAGRHLLPNRAAARLAYQ